MGKITEVRITVWLTGQWLAISSYGAASTSKRRIQEGRGVQRDHHVHSSLVLGPGPCHYSARPLALFPISWVRLVSVGRQTDQPFIDSSTGRHIRPLRSPSYQLPKLSAARRLNSCSIRSRIRCLVDSTSVYTAGVPSIERRARLNLRFYGVNIPEDSRKKTTPVRPNYIIESSEFYDIMAKST